QTGAAPFPQLWQRRRARECVPPRSAPRSDSSNCRRVSRDLLKPFPTSAEPQDLVLIHNRSGALETAPELPVGDAPNVFEPLPVAGMDGVGDHGLAEGLPQELGFGEAVEGIA